MRRYTPSIRVIFFMIIIAIALVTTPSPALEFGAVKTKADFFAVKDNIHQVVADYNLTKKGEQWKAVFFCCVCVNDKHTIYYGYDMVLDPGSAGPVLARFRARVQEACGECVAQPKMDLIRGEKEWADIKRQDAHWRKRFKPMGGGGR